MDRTNSHEQVGQAIFLEVDKHGEPNYGKLIKNRRECLGLTRKQLAELYGREIKGEPVTEKAIEIMEEHNQVPTNLARRRLLTRLLGIPPVMLGLRSLEDVLGAPDALPSFTLLQERRLDLAEYSAALEAYWERSNTKTAGDVIDEILERVGHLHSNVLYASVSQKEKMKQLLCCYHMLVADIAYDERYTDIALRYLDKAIMLATENHYHELQAAALFRHGNVLFSKGGNELGRGQMKAAHRYFLAAQHDYAQARRLKEQLPASLYGDILLQSGNIETRVAQHSIKEALKFIDRATEIARQGSVEEDGYNLKFNVERCHLDRASALLGSPLRALRYPDDALEYLQLVNGSDHPGLPRRHVLSYVLEARAYIDKTCYPVATEIARTALTTIKDINSGVSIARIERVYQQLKSTSFGNSVEVIQLGIDIWNAKQCSFPSKEA